MPAWKRLFPTANRLNVAIQLFSLIAIFFEGYDQGVMGGGEARPTEHRSPVPTLTYPGPVFSQLLP